jgi:transcriptional regulator GlxA family with amidase domain
VRRRVIAGGLVRATILVDGFVRGTRTIDREPFPDIDLRPDVLYVEDGPVLTSAGLAAGIDLCLHIIRTDYGAAVANAVARLAVVAPVRPGGQAQFIESPLPSENGTSLADTRAWALQRLHEPLTVPQQET